MKYLERQNRRKNLSQIKPKNIEEIHDNDGIVIMTVSWLLTLDRLQPLFLSSYCRLWTSKCQVNVGWGVKQRWAYSIRALYSEKGVLKFISPSF